MKIYKTVRKEFPSIFDTNYVINTMDMRLKQAKKYKETVVIAYLDELDSRSCVFVYYKSIRGDKSKSHGTLEFYLNENELLRFTIHGRKTDKQLIDWVLDCISLFDKELA